MGEGSSAIDIQLVATQMNVWSGGGVARQTTTLKIEAGRIRFLSQSMKHDSDNEKNLGTNSANSNIGFFEGNGPMRCCVEKMRARVQRGGYRGKLRRIHLQQ